MGPESASILVSPERGRKACLAHGSRGWLESIGHCRVDRRISRQVLGKLTAGRRPGPRRIFRFPTLKPSRATVRRGRWQPSRAKNAPAEHQQGDLPELILSRETALHVNRFAFCVRVTDEYRIFPFFALSINETRGRPGRRAGPTRNLMTRMKSFSGIITRQIPVRETNRAESN